MNRAAVSVFVVLALVLVGAACGDRDPEPSLPPVDFTPKATIAIDDGGVGCIVAADPTTCELGSGSVVTVANEDDSDHRLIGTNDAGGNVFDTGIMQPGDEMTLVLTAEGTITVSDVLGPGEAEPALEMTITPRPTEPG